MKKLYQKPRIRKLNKRQLERLAVSLVRDTNKLEELALIDKTTEIYNKRACERRLEEEKAKALRDLSYVFSYIQIDLDKFKVLNDTYGHLAGDAALAALAKEIKKNIRPFDNVYRIGGDEFAVVCVGDKKVAEEVENRIRKHIENCSFLYREKTISMSASTGSSQYSGSLDQMIDEADRKMYENKRSGGGKGL